MVIKRLMVSLLLIATCSWAIAVTRYEVSTDAQEVIDASTGLVWRRCAEGMKASQSGCTGVAATFMYDAALAHATAQAASGLAWRVPTLNELCFIADRNHENPAIDPVAFPSTPSQAFWSSTPHVRYSTYAWFVSFAYGAVLNDFSESAHHVRLVRNGSVLGSLYPSSTPKTPLRAGDDCPKL